MYNCSLFIEIFQKLSKHTPYICDITRIVKLTFVQIDIVCSYTFSDAMFYDLCLELGYIM